MLTSGVAGGREERREMEAFSVVVGVSAWLVLPLEAVIAGGGIVVGVIVELWHSNSNGWSEGLGGEFGGLLMILNVVSR